MSSCWSPARSKTHQEGLEAVLQQSQLGDQIIHGCVPAAAGERQLASPFYSPAGCLSASCQQRVDVGFGFEERQVLWALSKADVGDRESKLAMDRKGGAALG